jgi:hypothetical protein
MKKIIIIGMLVLTVAMAAPAMAFEKGTIRLGAGTGLLSTGTGFSSSTLDVDGGGSQDFDTFAVGMGYFLTDIIEVAFDYSNVDFGGGDVNIFGLAGKYYFPMGKNSLYAGGGFQTIDAFGGDDNIIYATGGYNYMFRDYFSIDFYLTYGKGGDFDLTDLGITYSVYFN